MSAWKVRSSARLQKYWEAARQVSGACVWRRTTTPAGSPQPSPAHVWGRGGARARWWWCCWQLPAPCRRFFSMGLLSNFALCVGMPRLGRKEERRHLNPSLNFSFVAPNRFPTPPPLFLSSCFETGWRKERPCTALVRLWRSCLRDAIARQIHQGRKAGKDKMVQKNPSAANGWRVWSITSRTAFCSACPGKPGFGRFGG